MDFTIIQYKKLLESLQHAGFIFQTFKDYISKQKDARDNGNSSLITHHSSLIILRHDVDLLPHHSLRFAQIQANCDIPGTYYFRMIPQSFNESIIKKIADLGHEIGYHYETMDTGNGNVDIAYGEFCRNLEKFQKLAPIKTISMHGSPMSSFDNREIWKKYDYRKLGILAEPYFDINFNQLYYITDTGRRWDGDKFNVRDKPIKPATVRGGYHPLEGNPDGEGRLTIENPITHPQFLKLRYHTTNDIIRAVNEGTFPKQAMLNFHPQRWNDKPLPWLKELIWQNVKNQGKRILVKAQRLKR